MVEEKGKELEKKRKELLEVYQQWYEQLTELLEKCPVFRDRQYSHPYYLHIPDDWYQSTNHILMYDFLCWNNDSIYERFQERLAKAE